MDFLKKLDAFPKTIDDFRVKTNSGGILSIISISLMICLFFSEIFYHMKTETVDHLYVNTTRTQRLKVSFDISFHVIPCKLLSIDVFDETGEPQSDIGDKSEIFKHRLSPEGHIKDGPMRHEIGGTLNTEKQLEELISAGSPTPPPTEEIGPCGNCYGAGKPGECCATCHDVKLAYDRRGWQFKPHEITQCKRESYIQTLREQFAEDGGCQIYGHIQINRASGHFHIAPHKDIHTAGLNAGFISLFDLLSFTFDQFNITHTINSLSFGETFPGIKNPLDGQSRKVEDTHGMYQYYLKIVPTKYKSLSGKVIESNQYSVTEHMRHLSVNSGRGLPGVYFNYEVSPVHALFEEKRKSWTSFITSVCAIVGGVFTVIGILDGVIDSIIKVSSRALL